MGAVVELELPFPPSENTYRRYVGNIPRISAKGRVFRKAVKAVALSSGFVPEGREAPPLNMIRVPVRVRVELYPADARRRDLDNYLKSLFDALTEAQVWEDDSLVRDLHVKMMSRVDGNPFCFVRISDLSE